MKRNIRNRHTKNDNHARVLQLNAKLDALYREWELEKESIAEQCEEEGYPGMGSNYELRCDSVWESCYAERARLLEDELYDSKMRLRARAEHFKKKARSRRRGQLV